MEQTQRGGAGSEGGGVQKKPESPAGRGITWEESIALAESVVYGRLNLSDEEALRCTLHRIERTLEWWARECEERERHTRIICYYQGQHKVQSPEDMWLLPSELARRQRDIIEGRVPFATFKKLSAEEIKNWAHV